MPLRVLNRYLVAERNHERLLETFVTDMLWAPANNKQFENYPRYSSTLKKDRPGTGSDTEAAGILKSLLGAWEAPK